MAATEAELEQKFTEVLTSRPATAPCGAMGRSIHPGPTSTLTRPARTTTDRRDHMVR
jgi:hypothetical protein